MENSHEHQSIFRRKKILSVCRSQKRLRRQSRKCCSSPQKNTAEQQLWLTAQKTSSCIGTHFPSIHFRAVMLLGNDGAVGLRKKCDSLYPEEERLDCQAISHTMHSRHVSNREKETKCKQKERDTSCSSSRYSSRRQKCPISNVLFFYQGKERERHT